jgi:hypothetical protein
MHRKHQNTRYQERYDPSQSQTQGLDEAEKNDEKIILTGILVTTT